MEIAIASVVGYVVGAGLVVLVSQLTLDTARPLNEVRPTPLIVSTCPASVMECSV